ncbi:unnamed protein product, partial [Adineta steineri]
SQTNTQISSTSLDDNQIEKTEPLNLSTPPQLPPLERKLSIKTPVSTSIPLTPMESTGFTVQSPPHFTNRSLSLFETTLVNSSVRHHKPQSLLGTQSSSLEHPPTNNKEIKAPSFLSQTSNDWKQQDYTNRLRDRLKSRGHLRKFFLS